MNKDKAPHIGPFRYLLIVAGLLLSFSGLTISQTRAESAGYALEFDGINDFVELGETTAIMGGNWSTTKTVEVWVYPTGPSPSCDNASPAFCDNIVGDRPRWWGISRGIMGGQDRIRVFNYDGQMRYVAIAYTPNEWVHITLVHGNGVLRAYKNGAEVGTIASGPTQQPSTGAQPVLHLGGIINNASRNWTMQGKLDEVRLWNLVRSGNELSTHMNAPLAGSESGLMAYYQMSNGQGITLTDDSGHGWSGTLFDGARGVEPNGGPATWVVSHRSVLHLEAALTNVHLTRLKEAQAAYRRSA